MFLFLSGEHAGGKADGGAWNPKGFQVWLKGGFKPPFKPPFKPNLKPFRVANGGGFGFKGGEADATFSTVESKACISLWSMICY